MNIAISGKIGSGKSTLAKTILNVLPASLEGSYNVVHLSDSLRWVMDCKFYNDIHTAIGVFVDLGYTVDEFKFIRQFNELASVKYECIDSNKLWSREAFIDFARLIRDFTDDSIFAKMTTYWYSDTVLIIPDVRHPVELEYLANYRHAVKIRVEADLEQRKKVCISRKRFSDNDFSFFDHPTETALDSYTNWDAVVYNDLTNMSCIENIAQDIIRDYILPNYKEVNALQ